MRMTSAEHRSIYSLSPSDEALLGLREVKSVLTQTVHTEPTSQELEDKSPEPAEDECSPVREVSDKMLCSACKCPFTSREEQMEHYKLDWHRFNLRLKISGLPPVTADEFERKTGAGDMSSISGSGSDSDEEDSDSESGGTSSNVTSADNDSSVESSLFPSRLSSKVVYQNSAGQYLSVYRCILQARSDCEQDTGSSLRAISKKTVWVILMTGGGHFAGAVFQGKEVLQHKTFHRYTVRAKRGTAQGLRDSQNRSHAPKSAGAALRRHNEAALVKDIQDLLLTWMECLKDASAIFVRAPSYNKGIFFGGRAAPFDKKDPRIHTLPFPTRRATFREVQRVHELLSTIQVYGKDTDMSTVFGSSKKGWKKAVKPTAQTTSKDERVLALADENQESSGEEDGGNIQLAMTELTIGTLDLREFEIHPSRNRRRRRKRKKEQSKLQNEELNHTKADNREEEELEAAASDNPSQETQSKNKGKEKPQSNNEPEYAVELSEYSLRDELFTACKVGDVAALRRLLQLPEEMSESHCSNTASPLALLNQPIDSTGFTVLHVASAAAQKAVIRLLLDVGADPACRDNKGQTPYIVGPDKETRKVFRQFMGENPDKYNYSKAQIPGPLTAEIESKKMEKKKAQKVLKKQREKEQQEERRKHELEAEEKKRFASLADREKRALVAERRLAQQVAATGVELSNVKRCWLCGESLLGKIPFQYLEYSFCTPHCVQKHRKANTLSGKP